VRSFTLALMKNRALELAERAEQMQHQRGHGRIFAGERQMLFGEFDVDTAIREALNYLHPVDHIARQAIHAVHDDRIAFAHVLEHFFQCRPLSVFG
jgi:hypothetical protein